MTSRSIGTRQPLAEAIVALAETPDDVPELQEKLERVSQFAADRIGAVDYAAVSARPSDGRCTVAMSGELAAAVSGASAAPEPSGSEPVATTMTWPNFRQEAAGMGLSIVSVPLFTGSGAARATLDLYGHDVAAMAPLTVGICAAYDPDLPAPVESEEMRALDDGGEELIAGFAEALSVRATIQLALSLIEGPEEDPYFTLRLDAAQQGISLSEAAAAVISSKLLPT
ncbi:hypothetical protein AB0F72_38515 [Actinoplanes sp. NPDC023936]|uniref:hypothetical protein n=1 Tax=Actinoplanes sp. NPDC023936 TaxID=3154910 RepID=UPI00340CE96D